METGQREAKLMEGDGGLKYWSQEGKQGRQSNLTVVLLEIEKQLFWLHKSIEFQIIDPVLNNLVQVSNCRNSQYVQTKNMIPYVFTVGIVNTLHACSVNTDMIQCSNSRNSQY